MELKRNIVGAGLILALSFGAVAVPAATTASHDRTTSISSVAAAPRAVASGSDAGTVRAIPAGIAVPASTAPSATNQQAGPIVRAFVNAVKNYSGTLYNNMVKAVKSGFTSFKNWLNTVPAFIKGLVGSLSASAIYDTIKAILGL
jgi:hypothetical protein